MNVRELLGLFDERPWMVHAACRGTDPELFFPGRDGEEAPALRICASCSVRDECLTAALEARERYGIWGGTTEQERRRLLRRTA